MKIISLAVLLCFYGNVSSYNANINVNHYGSCEKEIRSYQMPQNNNKEITPHTYLYIPNLRYNEAKEDEILRTKFYFRGNSDFSVFVSQHRNTKTGILFETGESVILLYFLSLISAYVSDMAYADNNSNSTIFKYILENDTKTTTHCDHINSIRNLFNTVYYEELLLVVSKGNQIHLKKPLIDTF